MAISDPRVPVDYRDGEGLPETRILQAVIQQDNFGPRAYCLEGAGRPLQRHPGRGDPGKKQRLVADLLRGRFERIDEQGAPLLAAVAAGDDVNIVAALFEVLGQRDRHRGLAGAAGRQVADADDRYAAVARSRRDGAKPPAETVEPAQWAEDRAQRGALVVPEVRCVHSCRSPTGPVPPATARAPSARPAIPLPVPRQHRDPGRPSRGRAAGGRVAGPAHR